MRINVYAEELTDETEVVYKTNDIGQVFYGVRVFLESPDVLHHTADDDDRSAITFWIPWTKGEGFSWDTVRDMLNELMERVDEAEVKEELR